MIGTASKGPKLSQRTPAGLYGIVSRACGSCEVSSAARRLKNEAEDAALAYPSFRSSAGSK